MTQQEKLFSHQDILAKLHDNLSLSDKLGILHQEIRKDFPFIDRISISLLDEKTNILKTYTQSTIGSNPLTNYEVPLSEAPSLREIIGLAPIKWRDFHSVSAIAASNLIGDL